MELVPLTTKNSQSKANKVSPSSLFYSVNCYKLYLLAYSISVNPLVENTNVTIRRDTKYHIKQFLLLFHTELPLITIHPERKTPMQGEMMTLSCNATGNPEPSISWVKDGSPINSNSRINFSQGNKRLTITNISKTDSGKYRCVARNRVGNDTLNSRVDVLCMCQTLLFPSLTCHTVFLIS